MATVNLRKRANGFYYLDWRDPLTGQRHVVSTKTTKEAQATTLRDHRQVAVDKGEVGIANRAAPLGPILEEYVAVFRAGHPETHTNAVRNVLERFIEDTKARKLGDVTLARAERFKAARLLGGAAPATVRLEGVFLKQWGKWLHEVGKLPQNPLAVLKHVKVNHDDIYALTADERKKVIEACPETAEGYQGRKLPLKAMVLCSFYAGLRLGEIRNLVWSDVEMENGTPMIHLKARRDWKPKGGRGRKVPIHPALLADILSRKAATNGTGQYVYGGIEPVRHNDAQIAFRRAMDSIGMPRVTWHVGRHTFATLHLSIGTPIFTVSSWLGHRNVKITQDYYGRYVADDHAKWIGAI